MFYSQFILAKKGPLGTIWIAAHLERKLRKNQVADTDIGVSVDSILFPEMPIALRLSSHLLLGVVRIYSKKVNYLFDDCSEALLKVKQAFRATAVDLPPEETTAPYHSITLPETFDLDDFELPDNELQGNFVDQHISSKDQITLQDTMDGIVYSTSKFGLDERFGDGEASGLDLEEELVEKAATPEPAAGASNLDNDPQASDNDDYSGDANQDFSDYDGDNEPIDYAQAPCTPGLWEEPNLSNIQDTSACDDHQEPERPVITESAVKENSENVLPHEHPHQFQPHEKSVKSPPHVAGTEQTMILDLGSTPFTEPVSTEPVIPVSNDPAKMDDLRNNNVRDQNLGFQTANYNRESSLQYQGNQENTFHIANELESNTGKDNLVHTPQHHASTPVLFTHDSMPHSNIPSLRPCVTFQDQETNSEASHATEALNRNFPEIHHSEIHQSHQFRVDNATTQQVAQVESINNYTNDYYAPVTQRVVQVESISNYTKDYSAPVTQRVAQAESINNYTNDYAASTPVTQRVAQVESISNYTKDYSAPVTQSVAQVESISNYTKDYSAPVTQSVAQVESITNYNQDYSAPVTQRVAQVESIGNYNQDYSAPVTQRVAQVESIGNYTQDYSAPVTQRVTQVESISNYANDYPASVPVNQRVAQVESINNYANDYSTPVTQSVVQEENVNSYANDFPAPEKRLSLPHWLSDVPKTFVPESTPVENDVRRGQKRNFTESSMSTHSLNLNESSGVFNTQVTSQSSDFNAHSGFYTTNTSAQSLNLNQSSGFHTTTTSGQNLNFGQPSGFFTTNTSGQNLNFNQSSGFFTTNTTAESLKSNQSAGIVTTNTTPQSLNLNQSAPAGSFSMDMTGRSAATDGDVLSSILVGRSILKTNPGPPVMTPSTKRRRAAAPKTGVPKRKVLMDDTMVLHGDTIRLQLTNTEDIRRLRKKAPCTRSEISMLEKQFWEDKIFGEPIFTGVSIKLASLHKQLYNLSKIVVSHDDTSLERKEEPKSTSQNDKKDTRVEVEPNAPKQNATVDPVAQPAALPNVDPVAQPIKLPNTGPVAQPIELSNTDPIVQPIELPKVTDSHTRDNAMVNLGYHGSQLPQMAATEHVTEPLNSEHDLFGERTAMEIDPKSFPDADVGIPVMPTEDEPPTHADVVPSDTFDMPAAMNEVQMDAPLQTNDPGVNSTGKIGVQSADVDINSIKSLESNIAPETDIDAAPPVKEVSEEKHDQDTEYRKYEEELVNEDAALASNVIVNEDTALASNVIVNEDTALASDAVVNEDVTLASNVVVNEDTALASNVVVNEDAALASDVIVNEDAALASNVESNIQNSVYHGIFGEEFGTVAAYDSEANQVSEIAQDKRENPDFHFTLDTTEMNVDDAPTHNKVDDDDDEVDHPAVENDTDFLNLDDADVDGADAGGDNDPDAEAEKVLDNSGWSSRTKAVAKYLQIMFNKEEERGKNTTTLAVNNLLVGKTRKEASRMFFETLVLKTKDYIHVEQTVPFENINIFPRAKLLKSEF